MCQGQIPYNIEGYMGNVTLQNHKIILTNKPKKCH